MCEPMCEFRCKGEVGVRASLLHLKRPSIRNGFDLGHFQRKVYR